MHSIAIDQKSIVAASAGQLDLEAVFTSLDLPPSDDVTRCIALGEHGYILSRRFQPDDALLVISLAADGPLTSLSVPAREQALARILKATSLFLAGRSRAIPLSWRPFHSNNRMSFQADRLLRSTEGGRTESGRIILELGREQGPRVFAASLDRTGETDLDSIALDHGLLREALGGVPRALSHQEAATPAGSIGNHFSLDSAIPQTGSASASYIDWYESRLTKAQRRFVDFPLPGSVRLVGPAGSGKTVALVVKCLVELHKTEGKGEQKRFLFLTHAASTATAIENTVLSMDPIHGIEFLATDRPSLTITTLQALANSQMRYNLDNLTPLSLDGYEGRMFQAEVLNSVIDEFLRGDWITYRTACSSPLISYMEAGKDSRERRFFLWELLNEFACVLDAEGVRSGTARRDQYLGEKRKAWMMVLETREDREVVLRLYDGFREWLRDENAIGTDQMIADFMTHLDGFRWEATRRKDGYDAVFVDELHLFTRQERMIFRQLLRNPDPTTIPTVLMAYDAKQSPRDAFLGVPRGGAQTYDLWKDARLGKVDKIELVDVFRYTPQIAAALKCIDQFFPGQDLDEEWPAYSGVAQTKDGPLPVVCTLASTLATYTTVFERARELQRSLKKRGRVAVLCVSNDRFKQFLDYKDLAPYFHAVTSRDDASSIPSSTKKFIFSAPEYIAGLQFDTVLLVEVNMDEVPAGAFSAAALRKFASQVYLGASRAERKLEIYASAEHGGIAPLVSQAVLAGAVRKIDPAELKYA